MNTDNFEIQEFELSETAIRHKIDNTIPVSLYPSLKILMEHLELIRAGFNKPVLITSGYRSPKLNTKIKGSKGSQHMRCEAADFTISKTSNKDVIDYIKKNVLYDQLIDEFGSWIHYSIKASGNRKEHLVFKHVNGEVVKTLISRG
jgi:zinc D-Ala-D-Ala carboxypeptidase